MRLVVLSPYQVEPLMQARREGRVEVETSPDLGITTEEVRLEEGGVRFSPGELLTWEEAQTIVDSKGSGRLTGRCYVLREGGLEEISAFSGETNRYYSLMPTSGAPTMLISGIPMHRIKGTDPMKDTREKLRAAAPVTGRVLDTTMGLGYTAIEAARTARHVLTVELDPAVLEICRLNPWSQELFDNPRIERRIGDSFEVIRELPDAGFDRVIHDPPTFSLAGQLYSAEFYREVYRVLTPGGRLFHYIGNPESGLGSRVTRGVVKRLRDVGFRRIVPKPEAFGVLAYK